MVNKIYTIEAQNSNPGPCEYENNPEASPKSIASKYPLINCTTTRRQRFDSAANKVPGPG